MKENNIREKLYKIKTILLERYFVTLGKQCTGEYIIYTFYFDRNKNYIVKYQKAHYQSKEGYRKKWRMYDVQMPVNEFVANTALDLLNRGYELEKTCFDE